MTVGPQFFETMKIPVLQGREFKPADYELTAKAEDDKKVRATVAEPVLVNEALYAPIFRR
jgi:hypothetical protein